MHDRLDSIVDPVAFIGRAPQQVQEFLAEEIRPILERYGKELSAAAADSVNV